MAATCAAPIKGSAFRMVKVDVCGVPVTGASSLVVVTKSFVQVQMAPQYDAGTEFFERTADGSICVNQKDAPVLKRMQLTVDFCSVDPDAIAYILSAREIATSAPVSGLGFALSEGSPVNKFSLEVWQYVAGSGACDASGSQRYVYNAWPTCGNAQIGSYTIQNGVSNLQIMCETFAASPLWGDGPGAGATWLPAGTPNPTGTEHWMWNITTIAPPATSCGSIALV